MKEYYLSVSKNGKFLFRTEPQPYDDFKKALEELKPLLDSEGIKFMLYRNVTQSSCTFDIHIDKTNAIDILDNLALDRD